MLRARSDATGPRTVTMALWRSRAMVERNRARLSHTPREVTATPSAPRGFLSGELWLPLRALERLFQEPDEILDLLVAETERLH